MYQQVAEQAAEHGLLVLGALHPAATKVQDVSSGTLLLLGTGPTFWPVLQSSPEMQDGARDPIDRWSKRILQHMAEAFGATAHYPFGGPPYKPFINWALASGRAFQSPAGPMVHDEVGMMISFRGALHFDAEFDIPSPPLQHSPCDICDDKPCLTACPVSALSASGVYDVPACYVHIAKPEGAECMEIGCLARRACPLSVGANRDPSQTAHHMSYFRPD